MQLFFKIIVTILCFTNSIVYAQGAIKVEVVAIEKKSLQEVFEYPASCRASLSKDFYAQQAGVIDFITVNQGKLVKANETLLTVDSEYAESLIASSLNNYKIASEVYKDNIKLHIRKIISDKALENSKLAQDTAKFKLDEAKQQYHNHFLQVPFDGVMGVVNFQVGDNIKPGDYLFTVTNGDKKTLMLDLPESFRKIVSTNFSLKALDSKGQEVDATILAFSDYLDPVSKTIKVSASVKDEGNFAHNSTVMCKIITNKHTNLALDESAVLEGPDGSFVFLFENNTAKAQLVKLGTRTDGYIEIISDDIKEGDLIIYKGLNKIYDKAAVEINNPTKTTE
ncbi:MAG: efflux RND transporter periplasmic adaptor subunit [Rickettsiaceae bacterium]|nr:efflux RND transporter periplasmic adaptor subunit [Rickettsiaceae bacterium]